MIAARRRFAIAVALSLLAHLAVVGFAPRPKMHRLNLSASQSPLIVTLAPAEPPEPAAVTAPPPPQPVPKRAPPPPEKRILAARPRTPRAAPPVPVPEEPKPAPAPTAPSAPAVDMLAMINARRERRKAAEAAATREGTPSGNPAADSGAAAISRNLETLKGDDTTGGVFQILEQGTLSAEYAFNGWRPDTQRRWREVIEVRIKPGEDIDLAIVRSMIELIRGHYQGDFLWESRRLGRVVTLSARAEDSAGLEEFLLREFFGTPVLNPSRR
jgi:type IV secretory pathway VirB10-like protein